MPANPAALKIAAEINKTLKAEIVVPASNMAPLTRIPTGSLSLDVLLGGGWPVNRWIEVVGDPSNGKTATLLKTIAENQRRDPEFTVVWVAAEDYDKDWAAKCGVVNDRVLLIETNIMEDAYESVLKFLESKTVDMVVIDSLPAMVPITEDEKAMDESTVGRGALLTNKFFRKALSATKRAADGSERGVTCFVVNQWREKIGVMYGDPRTTPGGKGKDYAYSIKVEVRRDKWLEEGTGDNKVKVGLTMAYRATKNKTAPIGNKAFVDFYFKDAEYVDAGQIDFGKEIVSQAVLHGIVERRGGWYYYGSEKWQGQPDLVTQIRSDLTLKESLEKEVLNVTRVGDVSED